MGCDVHMAAEVCGPSGKWSAVGLRENEGRLDDYQAPGAVYGGGRNYSLFAILADVRNGHGFAGVRTGEGFVPISAPRGAPPDASEAVLRWVDEWGPDGHDLSWHALRQLDEYDWTRSTTLTGLCELSEWARFKLLGRPSSWAADVGGARVVHVSDEDASAAIPRELLWQLVRREEAEIAEAVRFLGLSPVSHPYVRVSWRVAYHEEARDFLSETLSKLRRLGGPDDVRIVFFFDN